jgi:hypothetical protein
MRLRAWVLTAIAGCGGGLPTLPSSDAGPSDAAMEADAKTDADAGACNPASAFGAPVLVTGAGLGLGFEYAPSLTADELAMYWTSTNGDASTQVHIFAGTRTSVAAPFGPASLIGVNGATNDSDPALTTDALTLYFQTDRDDFKGDIYVAHRSDKLSDFSNAIPVVDVNDPSSDDTQPAPDVDGSLWFASDRLGGGTLDIFHALSIGDGGFDAPTAEPELNSAADDWSPTLTADGLKMFFASKRAGGVGNDDIYVATRTSIGVGFGVPIPVSELNTKDSELPHWISPDGCRLYLARNTGVAYAIYVVTRGK